MSRQIPEPVRAAAGLAATVLDEVRKLPETLPGLPFRAIGLAMQAALKVQQEYAGLVARGDELFTGIRGESEPGLATFDDDEDAAPAPAAAPAGFRDSAFDRAASPGADTGADTGADAAEGAEQVEQALADLEEMALEDVAIEELVDASPAADAVPVDVPDAAGGVTTVDAVVTDEGVATVEPAGTATDEGGTPIATAGDALPAATPALREPVSGYDGFSIAQLRGRLRGYAASTVEELLAYEEASRSREPYLRMLRNRLERLTAEEVAASPLAPRGG